MPRPTSPPETRLRLVDETEATAQFAFGNCLGPEAAHPFLPTLARNGIGPKLDDDGPTTSALSNVTSHETPSIGRPHSRATRLGVDRWARAKASRMRAVRRGKSASAYDPCATLSGDERMQLGDRDPDRPADVHDVDLSGADEFVHRRTADRQHARRFDDRQQQQPVCSLVPFVRDLAHVLDKRAGVAYRDKKTSRRALHTRCITMPGSPATPAPKIGTDMPVPLTAEPGRQPAGPPDRNPQMPQRRLALDRPDRCAWARADPNDRLHRHPSRTPTRTRGLTDVCTRGLHAR